MNASAAEGLVGLWGGDRMRLTIEAGGANLQADCATGRIAGPIELSPAGTFAATGVFEQHRPGPQRADTNAAPPGARYSGEVKGDTMTLSILPEGASTPLSFELRKGVDVKLVRCL